MSYDNTKLAKAIQLWLRTRCRLGYGLVYSGDLLVDFEDYLSETGLLKSSPGPVPFGKELRAAGLQRKRQGGLTYYEGIELRKPIQTEPRRRPKGTATLEAAFERRDEIRAEARQEHVPSEQERLERINQVKREMEKENAARIRAGGEL